MAKASIVFRNEDMTSTGKIYVDTMEGAGELAARFRNASHWVDVINRRDEVEHRWENGNPDWRNSDVLYFHNGHAPYDFIRKGDGWWVPDNRLKELSEMLSYSFDVAVGHKDRHVEYSYLSLVAGPDWTLEALVDEAEDVKNSAPTDDAEAWTDHMLAWMQDSSRLYLKYRAEYAALLIQPETKIYDCRVARLEIELAEIDANFALSKREIRN